MRLKILGLFTAVALVAACTSTPEQSAATSGAGESRPTATQAGPGQAARPGIVPGSQEDLRTNVGDRVFFDFDKFNLRPDARETLNKQATWLRRFPNVTVTIEGHADERGTREYNLALGERRANSAKDFLIALGISPARVRTVSFGKERPEDPGHDESAWSKNRRAVTMISGGAPAT